MQKTIIVSLLFLMSFIGCKPTQKTRHESPSINKKVLVVYDGIPANKTLLDNLDKNDVAEIIVLKGEAATNLYGKKAKKGAVLITSKKAATRIYQKNLSLISQEYSKKIKLIEENKDLLYIINNEPLINNYEHRLMHLKRNEIKEIILIDSKKTKLDFGIESTYGAVLILTK